MNLIAGVDEKRDWVCAEDEQMKRKQDILCEGCPSQRLGRFQRLQSSGEFKRVCLLSKDHFLCDETIIIVLCHLSPPSLVSLFSQTPVFGNTLDWFVSSSLLLLPLIFTICGGDSAGSSYLSGERKKGTSWFC